MAALQGSTCMRTNIANRTHYTIDVEHQSFFVAIDLHNPPVTRHQLM
jgi:hypothetical protein